MVLVTLLLKVADLIDCSNLGEEKAVMKPGGNICAQNESKSRKYTNCSQIQVFSG